MNTDQHSPQNHTQSFVQQRKLLTVAPAFVIPFLVLIFWLFGGGSTTRNVLAEQSSTGALNISMPEASLKKEVDKLDIYQQSEMSGKNPDSMATLKVSAGADTASLSGSESLLAGLTNNRKIGSNETLDIHRIHQQSDRNALQYNTAPAPPTKNRSATSDGTDPLVKQAQQEVSHIYRAQKKTAVLNAQQEEEELMKERMGLMERRLSMMQANRLVEDYNKMQNGSFPPGSAPSHNYPQSPAEQDTYGSAYGNNYGNDGESTSAAPKGTEMTELAPTSGIQTSKNAFYGTGTFRRERKVRKEGMSIEAVVHSSSTIVSGSTVKLRLLNDMKLADVTIPKNSFLYGVATIDGERVKIEVGSLRHQQDVYPLKLNAYDLDGQLGLFLPGGIERDLAKATASQTIGSVPSSQFFVSSNSTASQQVAGQVAGQVAQTSVEGVKGLLSRRARMVKATLKANYKLILK